ncbi:hypothetical protein EON82_22255 [bacterium]|nr:MAG: hypothetical protein EON82_22255 [bacterium]
MAGRQRGIGPNTWAMLRVRRPFVLLDGGRVGLMSRDSGASEEVARTFCDDLFRSLDKRQVGLRAVEVREMAARHGIADSRAARSVLLQEGRFRTTQGGAVGLAEWEDVRSSTQAELLQELLNEHDGIVPVETVIDALPTVSGERLSRVRIGLLANSIRARLVGGFVEWMPDALDGENRRDLVGRVIAVLPEAAAPRFCELMAFPAASPSALPVAVADWTEVMRKEAQRNSHVEAAQVERLVTSAARMLELAQESLTVDEQTLVNSALGYLASLDDGVADTALGGLDDDEAVLKAVEAAVRASLRRRVGSTR